LPNSGDRTTLPCVTDMESDAFARRFRRGQQERAHFLDHIAKRHIVADQRLFNRGKSLFQNRVGRYFLAQTDEGPDDIHTHGDGVRTVEYVGGLKRTMCSVKAHGSVLRPPRPEPAFAIAICDVKESSSSLVSWKRKSPGKRAWLRFTASLNRKVCTPYRRAKSTSKIMRWPRTEWMTPSTCRTSFPGFFTKSSGVELKAYATQSGAWSIEPRAWSQMGEWTGVCIS
jgi:hypothetical protein